MSTWVRELQSGIRVLWNASVFRSDAFTAFRDRRDVFFRGFLIVLVIALLVGLPALIAGLVDAGRPVAELGDASEAARAGFEQGLAQVEPLLRAFGMSTEGLDQIAEQVKQGMAFGMGIAARVMELPTILPKPLGGILGAFGAWVSRPFGSAGFPLSQALLATWLGYGIWVMLFAKLLGGRATLAQFFGVTALYAVPHVLNVFAPLPIAGPLLGLLAFVWGVAIYVKATAVSHQLPGGRALLAVFLPIAVVFVLGFVVATGFVALVVSTASQ